MTTTPASTMSLTVLGSAGTHPANGRACSSYLVEAQGYRLLLDCGNGSLANLTQRIDVADLDAVIISHLHPDHFVDLYGLHYALRFHPSGPLSVPVYAPAGARSVLTSVLGDSGESFLRHCELHTAVAGTRLELGPLDVSLFEAHHVVETLAARVHAGGRTVAFSGDSAPTPQVVACARDADLFLCDSSWLEADGPHPDGVHMTGAQAGEQAAQAGARTLLVTHVFPTNDPEEVAAEARTRYDGTVIAVADLEEYPL